MMAQQPHQQLLGMLLLLAAATSTGMAATYTFKAKYQMRNPVSMPNASISGTLYYHYSDKAEDSRVLYENELVLDGSLTTVSELYHYRNKAVYSMCPDSCTALKLTTEPDKWWYQAGDTEDGSEGEYMVYSRAESATSSVVELLLKNKNAPGSSGFGLGRVAFKDGREVHVVGNIEMTSYSQSKFEPSARCPEPVCKNFIDVVFVVDASATVDEYEWIDTMTFVRKVLDNFEVGNDAAAFALIQFNSPHETCLKGGKDWKAVACKGVVQKVVEKGARRPSSDCDFDHNCDPSRDNTAQVDISLTTVASQKNSIATTKQTYGHTCQRYGLELAYEELFEKNPRMTTSGKGPTPIVIVVTDGEDDCPNSTVAAANRLKEKGVMLLEVGVGLQLNYDKRFIEDMTTKIPGYESVLLVDNYDQVSAGIQKLIEPVCSTSAQNGGCSTECKAACACGKCVCATCDVSPSKCVKGSCEVRNDKMSSGCVYSLVDCDEGDKCYNYWCDDQDGSCHSEPRNCREELGLKQCQEVQCYKDHGCLDKYVSNIDNRCTKVDECHTAACDPADSSADATTGCVQVDLPPLAVDYPACQVAKCDPATGRYIEDTCEQEYRDNKCYKSHCTADGCVVERIDPQDMGKCVIATCDNSTGYTYTPITAEDCRKDLGGEESMCIRYFCNKGTGQCESKVIPDCNACNGTQSITHESCQKDTLELERKPDECWSSMCVMEDGMPKCRNELVACPHMDCHEAVCVVDPETGKGTCQYTPIENPFKEQENKCYASKCVYDHYEIEYIGACSNDTDKCVIETCVNETGACHQQPRCPHKPCMNEVCNSADGTCNYTARTCQEVNRCLRYECDDETDSCQPVVVTDHGCDDGNLCTHDSCDIETGECVFTALTHEASDNCTVYECDPATGNWSEGRPKCDDGLWCTEDVCSNDGECTYPEVECGLSMEDYPCFREACTEARHCYRRLVNNAYIDICGNCLDIENISASDWDAYLAQLEAECMQDVVGPTEKTALTAAAIAGIVIAAVVGVAALATTSVFTTRELVRRAAQASTAGAHENPLYESEENEMSNPAFMGN